MREQIIEKLREIERNEQIRILLAVESGSRAWGFASPDSDYDVRFLYVRPENEYLKLENTRDVIELPINDELDINGWDLKKALRLMHKSNPTLFEWLSSPVVYVETDTAERLRELSRNYFSVSKSLHHYLHMAETNYRGYLRGEKVRAKKYFYVLRPLLACRWILEKGTPPPMLFSELMEAELPGVLKDEVDQLLDIKMNSPEIKVISRIDAINAYLDRSIEEMNAEIRKQEKQMNPGWDELDDFFINTVKALN